MHSKNTGGKYCWYPAQYPQDPAVLLGIFTLSPVLGNTAKLPQEWWGEGQKSSSKLWKDTRQLKNLNQDGLRPWEPATAR